jgi:hypothetical protein
MVLSSYSIGVVKNRLVLSNFRKFIVEVRLFTDSSYTVALARASENLEIGEPVDR